MGWLRLMIAGAAGLTLAACSPQAATQSSPAPATSLAATHAVSGLPVIPLTITSAGGRAHAFRVEVAASPQEQARGLMFRTALGPDEGMIFPYRTPGQLSFWMKNTPLPLDIIFIAEGGRIANIAAITVPYSRDPVLSEGAAIAVLEIPGGRAAQLGIRAGDRVAW
ncbi:DUF192 domain-containing protein [Qipengyuania sp. YIM B01966]|uniref:DUF192 domain-containing protein n=1 Tax=Qipengyuania sp. YIM B01966 TaxID=2778646 RepID=UPI0018F75995|nr:DUF192 domain-containing protein [Qipengyuania sp. YIM B01966]